MYSEKALGILHVSAAITAVNLVTVASALRDRSVKLSSIVGVRVACEALQIVVLTRVQCTPCTNNETARHLLHCKPAVELKTLLNCYLFKDVRGGFDF